MSPRSAQCTDCGATLKVDDQFCTSCGHPVAIDRPTEPQPPVPPGTPPSPPVMPQPPGPGLGDIGGPQPSARRPLTEQAATVCQICGTPAGDTRFCTICGSELRPASPAETAGQPAMVPPPDMVPPPTMAPPPDMVPPPTPGRPITDDSPWRPAGHQPPPPPPPGPPGRVDQDPWSWPQQTEPPPEAENRRRRGLLVGAGLAVVTLLAAGAALTLLGNDESDPSTDVETARSDDADGSTDEDPATGVDPDEATTGQTVEPESTTTASTTTTTIPPTTAFFAGRDVLYGQYVAVLWSDFGSATPPTGGDSELEQQLEDLRARFGDQVQAIDSNQFGSLRNGTVAVVFAGEFSSARDAKQWCRNNGYPGTQDCFGVVLSDDYEPDERGEFVRVYDL